MDSERKRIVDMLEQGKITADQAEKLLIALGEPEAARSQTATAVAEPPQGEPAAHAKGQYLHILVEKAGSGPEGGEKVNICVPLRLLRAGVKLGNLLPAKYRDRIRIALEKRGYRAGEHGDIWDAVVDKIADLSVDVENAGERVKVYCD